jgi:hypothetical protein
MSQARQEQEQEQERPADAGDTADAEADADAERRQRPIPFFMKNGSMELMSGTARAASRVEGERAFWVIYLPGCELWLEVPALVKAVLESTSANSTWKVRGGDTQGQEVGSGRPETGSIRSDQIRSEERGSGEGGA